MNPGAEFSLPPLCKLLSKPTRIGRGPQGPFGKLIRKVVTDALAIKKKKRGEKLSQNFKKNAAAAARQFYCCQILFFFFFGGHDAKQERFGEISDASTLSPGSGLSITQPGLFLRPPGGKIPALGLRLPIALHLLALPVLLERGLGKGWRNLLGCYGWPKKNACQLLPSPTASCSPGRTGLGMRCSLPG